jgi:hypothetical protein
MVELVHDQSQIHAQQTGMISPGFSQTVGTKVSPKTDLLADGSDELPGLTTTNGFSLIMDFRIEEKEMLWIGDNIGISLKILLEYLTNARVDKDLMTFAPFLLFDLKTTFDVLLVIQEVPNL